MEWELNREEADISSDKDRTEWGFGDIGDIVDTVDSQGLQTDRMRNERRNIGVFGFSVKVMRVMH